MTTSSTTIIKSIPMLDILKQMSKTSVSEIGQSETTGIKGVNKSFKVTTSDGRSWIMKPGKLEHVSRWRYIPKKHGYVREKAAYLIDQQLGFDRVPETKMVKDDKYGPSSFQEWLEGATHIKTAPDTFLEGLDQELVWQCAIFDAVIGNTDRHFGNVMIFKNKVWLIDNGYAFPARAIEGDPKSLILSRFVVKMWNKEIPMKYLDALENLKEPAFRARLARMLDRESYDLFVERLNYLLRTGVLRFPKYGTIGKLKGIPGEGGKGAAKGVPNMS